MVDPALVASHGRARRAAVQADGRELTLLLVLAPTSPVHGQTVAPAVAVRLKKSGVTAAPLLWGAGSVPFAPRVTLTIAKP